MASTSSSPPVDVDDIQAGDGIEISAPRARQAYTGKRILMILVASIALVIVAFLIAYATNPTHPVSHSSDRVTGPAASSFHAPQPAPKEP